jgi:hypothetical protein
MNIFTNKKYKHFIYKKHEYFTYKNNENFTYKHYKRDDDAKLEGCIFLNLT